MSKAVPEKLEDVILPDNVATIPNGLQILNLADVKTRTKVLFLNKKELTFDTLLEIILESLSPLRLPKGQKRPKTCKVRKCRGTIFERIKETEAGDFNYITWRCVNCGDIHVDTQFSARFKNNFDKKHGKVTHE